MLPRFLTRLRLGRFILRLLAGFRATYRPSLVRLRHLVNERIVEVPFVLRNISEHDRLILDIGCCDSVLPLEMAHLGFKVWGIDQRKYALSHPNLTFVQGDVCQLCFPSSFFDVAISLSTLEHIGMGHYGDSLTEQGDALTLKELRRVLKPQGKLILTAPFGKPRVSWQRVYGPEDIAGLLSDFSIEQKRFFKKQGEMWLEAREGEVRDIDSPNETQAIVLLVARKPA